MTWISRTIAAGTCHALVEPRSPHRVRAAIIAAAAVCFGAGVLAGPFLPAGGGAPDTVQSLADFVDQVRIRIGTPPEIFQQAGVTEEFIETRLRKQLEQKGIAVVDDDNAPVLDFSTFAVSEPKAADAVAYLCIIQVEQKVRLERLDRELLLPTFYYHMLGIEPPEAIAQTVRDSVTGTIRGLFQHIQMADR